MRHVAVAVAALLLVAHPASAQRHEAQAALTRQLDRFGGHGRAIRLTRVVARGALAQGEQGGVWLRMGAGRQYTLIPVCDEDCSDIAVTVLDAAGNELARSRDVDDIPMATLTPGRTATYRVRVEMLSCAMAPCAYAVGLYAR